jgi:hypothetical protein
LAGRTKAFIGYGSWSVGVNAVVGAFEGKRFRQPSALAGKAAARRKGR